MDALHDSYEWMLFPQNFVKNFADMEHFKDWCRTGLIKDLRCDLKSFENHEMYDYCIVIQQVIDEKIDDALMDFGIE